MKHPVGDDFRFTIATERYGVQLYWYIRFVTFVWHFCHFVSTDKIIRFDVPSNLRRNQYRGYINYPSLCGYTPLYFTRLSFLCPKSYYPLTLGTIPQWYCIRLFYCKTTHSISLCVLVCMTAVQWLWSFVVYLLHPLSTIGIAYTGSDQFMSGGGELKSLLQRLPENQVVLPEYVLLYSRKWYFEKCYGGKYSPLTPPPPSRVRIQCHVRPPIKMARTIELRPGVILWRLACRNVYVMCRGIHVIYL